MKRFFSRVLCMGAMTFSGGYAELDSSKLDVFGVSTAAYQIEGAWNVDGKGESIWDRFSHVKGIENGDVACEEYDRVTETIQLLKELGVNSYRFSIAWTRIQPNGTGKANEKGIAYYRYLIDELNKAGIAPMVTLYHWDMPQALEDKGGWANRKTVDHFVEYAKILFREFGKDVKYWITHNEPRVISTLGYGTANMAPGTNDRSLIKVVNHHLLLSHGYAVKAYKEMNFDGKIGIALNLKPIYCFEGGDALEAAEMDKTKNRDYVEPLLLGKYPGGNRASYIMAGDMDIISFPIDFLGVNYYSRMVISTEEFKPKKTNCLGWEVYPKGIYDLLIYLKRNYPKVPPIIITENGFADHHDNQVTNGVQDGYRSAYINAHVKEVLRAKEDGVPVEGYFVWSLLDNFEWSFGYKPRFGLVHVNYETQARTPKASYYVYKQIVKEHLK